MKTTTQFGEKGSITISKGFDGKSIDSEQIKVIHIEKDAEDFVYNCHFYYCNGLYFPVPVAVEVPDSSETIVYTNERDSYVHLFIAHKVVISNGIVRIYRFKDDFVDNPQGEDCWTDLYCDYTELSI